MAEDLRLEASLKFKTPGRSSSQSRFSSMRREYLAVGLDPIAASETQMAGGVQDLDNHIMFETTGRAFFSSCKVYLMRSESFAVTFDPIVIWKTRTTDS